MKGVNPYYVSHKEIKKIASWELAHVRLYRGQPAPALDFAKKNGKLI